MTPSPPSRPSSAVVTLYDVMATDRTPIAERTEITFGFHDAWPADMGEEEWIQISLSDGSSRIARNEAGHMMLLGQLQTLASQREGLTFTAYRCRPVRASA